MAEFYRVKQEDNLNGIARSFSLSIEEIKQANGITEIYEGQLLMIPSCSRRYITVHPFEDWEAVSLRTGVSVQRLKQINGAKELYPLSILFLE